MSADEKQPIKLSIRLYPGRHDDLIAWLDSMKGSYGHQAEMVLAALRRGIASEEAGSGPAAPASSLDLAAIRQLLVEVLAQNPSPPTSGLSRQVLEEVLAESSLSAAKLRRIVEEVIAESSLSVTKLRQILAETNGNTPVDPETIRQAISNAIAQSDLSLAAIRQVIEAALATALAQFAGRVLPGTVLPASTEEEAEAEDLLNALGSSSTIHGEED